MKKLTILLEDALHRKLRFRSVETGESLQKMAVRLLRAELKRRPARRTTRRR